MPDIEPPVRRVSILMDGDLVTCRECRHPGPVLPFASITFYGEAEGQLRITPHTAWCERKTMPRESMTVNYRPDDGAQP